MNLDQLLRTLFQAHPWHGIEPGLKGDGDPLDVCVLTEKSIAGGKADR